MQTEMHVSTRLQCRQFIENLSRHRLHVDHRRLDPLSAKS